MFSRFKNEEEPAADVKIIRDKILRFLKEQLQQWEGGEGQQIRGLQLFVFCSEAEKSMYEAALFTASENRFKDEELQRIADDYALSLPDDWSFDILFAAAPPEAVLATNLPVALFTATKLKKSAGLQPTKASIIVLQGEAEQERYAIDQAGGKITIGRDKLVQAADGFHRENKIAFLAGSSNEANKFVSRQHAHIEWNEAAGGFLLFADEGGIPPRNKVKVRPRGGEPVKLQSTHIGYTLQAGDQIMLGDNALLEFRFD